MYVQNVRGTDDVLKKIKAKHGRGQLWHRLIGWEPSNEGLFQQSEIRRTLGSEPEGWVRFTFDVIRARILKVRAGLCPVSYCTLLATILFYGTVMCVRMVTVCLI